MFKDRIKIYQLYHTVISTALTWAVVLVVNQYFVLRVNFLLSIIYCLIPAALLYLFSLNRKSSIGILLLASIIPVMALVFWAAKINTLTLFKNILDWCYTYNGSEELYVAAYANIILFFLTVISSIIIYLLTIRQLTKVLLGIANFTALIVLSIYGFDINKVVVGISFLYILTIILEIYEKFYTRKAGRAEKREGILYLVPVCLLLVLLSVSLPSKSEPIQWKLFKIIYNTLSDKFDELTVNLNYYFSGSSSEFSISMTGYSEKSGKLKTSGRLVNDEKIPLKVSDLKKGDAVYLIGSVSDTYTGSSWEKSWENGKTGFVEGYDDYWLDSVELFYALARLEPEVVKENKFIEWHSLRILYNSIKTKTFFHPGKMTTYSFYSSYDKIDLRKPQITFKKPTGKNTFYQTNYYEMNLKGEAFIQLLKEMDSFSYNDPQYINNETADYLQFNTIRQSKLGSIFDSDCISVLKERSEIIKNNYTGLPDDLPDRVYQLAARITDEYETKYEKLKAIEAYLLNNYEYSRSAPNVPPGVDYIDYFLFEDGTGYCTSFATAMAVLGRCIGIPTRYVEGYIARFENKDNDNMYIVKNSNAHAWAEAYFEGIGWIPFEATAPYHNVRYTEWKTNDDKYNYKVEVDDDYWKRYYEMNSPQVTPAVVMQKEVDEKEDDMESLRVIIAAVIIICVICTVIIIYYNVLKFRYKRVFDKSNYNDKLYMLFLRILRLLKKEGFEMSPDETLIMLADRVKDHFCYEGVSFYEVAEVYMRFRYADEEITAKEYEKVAVYQHGMANKYRSENSRWKVWLDELIFLSRAKV